MYVSTYVHVVRWVNRGLPPNGSSWAASQGCSSLTALICLPRAAAYSKLGNYAGAVQDCERAICIDPSYSKAYGRMG